MLGRMGHTRCAYVSLLQVQSDQKSDFHRTWIAQIAPRLVTTADIDLQARDIRIRKL